MGSSAEPRDPGASDIEHRVLRLWAINRLWGGRTVFAFLALGGSWWAIANVSVWFFPTVAVLAYLAALCSVRWLGVQRQYRAAFAELRARTGIPIWMRPSPRAYLHQRSVFLQPGEVNDPVLRLMRRAPARAIAAIGLMASLVRLIVLLWQ
jgi:hypothetical protein